MSFLCTICPLRVSPHRSPVRRNTASRRAPPPSLRRAARQRLTFGHSDRVARMFRALVRALEESESHRLRAHTVGLLRSIYVVMQLCHTYDLAQTSAKSKEVGKTGPTLRPPLFLHSAAPKHLGPRDACTRAALSALPSPCSGMSCIGIDVGYANGGAQPLNTARPLHSAQP